MLNSHSNRHGNLPRIHSIIISATMIISVKSNLSASGKSTSANISRKDYDVARNCSLCHCLWLQKTFVTASTSRRKQQQELLARAVTAAKLARDEARRLFHLTTSSVLELAGTEVVFSKDHRGDEAANNEDGLFLPVFVVPIVL